MEWLRADVASVEPRAFLVLPRVLRRVIKKDLELPTIGMRVPHRKSYVIDAERLAPLVERDELGLDPAAAIPPVSILVPRPDDWVWETCSDSEIRTRVWRLLYHAVLDAHYQKLVLEGRMDISIVHERIDQIGQVAFDEIVSVLKREHFLIESSGIFEGYGEFASVFAELSAFAPAWLPVYFPSIDNMSRIASILEQDFDLDGELEKTCLPGTDDPQSILLRDAGAEGELPSENDELDTLTPQKRERRYQKFMNKARRTQARGNSVGAAIACRRALEVMPDESSAKGGVQDAIDDLVARLQAALEFNENDARDWRAAVAGLVENSIRGFWNSDRKLLFDLQKVCVDHEKGVYTVDLVEFIRTFGKRPLKRALPNQREVLMSKHLRNAERRLVSAKLSGSERDRWGSLLKAAASSAEKQLRRRLRPLVTTALDDVGLLPENPSEQVSREKLIDELIDCVVQRGYLTMGYFRDALSRNQLKLADLSGVRELWSGDRLLQADKRLDVELDGVYHRGEFYLRWLQGMSSLAFGTRLGRFVTQFLAIPFGGSFVALNFLMHVVGWFTGHDSEAATTGQTFFPIAVVLTGFVIMGLIHVELVRSMVVGLLKNLWKLIRQIFYDVPRWIISRPLVRGFWRSKPVVFLRRYIASPGVPTFVMCHAIPWLVGGQGVTWQMTLVVFLCFNLIFNSRLGRDCEEILTEWLGHTWYRIRVGVFVALFEATMEFFKWLLESFERVLYAVDEWLRFRSGETSVSLGIKAILGVFWSMFTFVTRFCVTLLIEPQINPIKHFPVVTVSHKIILPMEPTVASLLEGVLGLTLAHTVAAVIVFTVPGIFGFLVWELKSNWRLYAANRSRTLKPVLVGDHGETMIRLMKPGFHSGTLPKLYSRLRRAERKAVPGELNPSKSKYRARLNHLQESVRHFAERELLQLLRVSPAWSGELLNVGRIELASNSIRIEIERDGSEMGASCIAFQEQSGWLVASIRKPGWMAEAAGYQVADLIAALAGFYKISGVDLVREQVESCFQPEIPPYDVTDYGLIVWPGGDFHSTVFYNLNRRSTIRPSPGSVARRFGLHPLESERLLFGHSEITWAHWVSIWQTRVQNPESQIPFSFPVRLLPSPEQRELSASRKSRT